MTKPVIYCANVAEHELAAGNEYVERVREYAKKCNADVVMICAQIEAELVSLGKEEAENYLKELGFSGISVGTAGGAFVTPNSTTWECFLLRLRLMK